MKRSPATTRRQSLAGVALGLACLACLPGCNAGAISDENTRLRRENHELGEKLTAAQADLERRQAQFAALESKANLPKPALEGVRVADLPVVTKLVFSSYSGVYDSDGDGVNDTVRIYLQPLDQRGRFYPAVGKAVLQVVAIEAGKPPVEITARQFSPKEFDAAYVDGFTGTHFTLEAKLPAPLPDEVTIKVTFTDAETGAQLTQQMTSKLKTP